MIDETFLTTEEVLEYLQVSFIVIDDQYLVLRQALGNRIKLLDKPTPINRLCIKSVCAHRSGFSLIVHNGNHEYRDGGGEGVLLNFLKKFPRMFALEQHIQNNSDRPKLTQGLAGFLEIRRGNDLKLRTL